LEAVGASGDLGLGEDRLDHLLSLAIQRSTGL
jgi:hypothetical protein